ncbi:hypothetical protein LIER_11030 [Lithospermum erythrorhizon]|uniref:Uncharacterized protein n=1 Tax=Lithospermum erythrorhizon TaxID=34254 RepID=A0AAV3PMT1_LITER
MKTLNLQLERMMRNLRMMNAGNSKFHEILQIGQTPGDVSDICYGYQGEGTQTGQRQVPPGQDRSQTRPVYLEQGQKNQKWTYVRQQSHYGIASTSGGKEDTK